MREQSRRLGRPWEPFRGSEMQDLVAFLYFLRMQDPPGDPARGARLFDEKRCSTCHALGGEGSEIGPDLARWKRLASPVLWAEAMWKHATQMEKTMHEMSLSWPTFAEGDMVDLIAFIRQEAARDGDRRGKIPARGK